MESKNTEGRNVFTELKETNEFALDRLSVEVYVNRAESLLDKFNNDNIDRFACYSAIYESVNNAYKILEIKLRNLWESPMDERERMLKEGHFLYFELGDLRKDYLKSLKSYSPDSGKKGVRKWGKGKAK
jgi:hypothetical protein